MSLPRSAAAALLPTLTPEEQQHAEARRSEILAAGGSLADAIRVPIEEIAAARASGGGA